MISECWLAEVQAHFLLFASPYYWKNGKFLLLWNFYPYILNFIFLNVFIRVSLLVPKKKMRYREMHVKPITILSLHLKIKNSINYFLSLFSPRFFFPNKLFSLFRQFPHKNRGKNKKGQKTCHLIFFFSLPL